MNSSITNHQKNIAALIQLSVFSKYIFPLGNFITPIILWTLNKSNSIFVDYNGKQAINFQLSMVLYRISIAIIGIPIFVFNTAFSWNEFHITLDNSFYPYHSFYPWHNTSNLQENLALTIAYVTIYIGLFSLELYCIIMAALKAKEGNYYKFPITINFIK